MATNCGIANNIDALECFEGSGGVDLFYIANYNDISGVTEANSLITAIDMISTAATFYTVTPNANSSFWNEEDNGEVANGTVGGAYTQVVTCNFTKKDSDTVNNVKLMARGRLVLIVKENDGSYHICGKNRGMTLNATRESGTLIGDKNGYSLIFTSIGEKDPASVVDETVIPTIL